MGRFNFCSGTYQSLSPNANAEWCANLYPENAASPNARSAVQLYPTPGLELFATLPSSLAVPGGTTFLGRTFSVAINAASGHAHLYEITNNPVTAVDRGDLGVPTNSNPAIFAANPTQLVFTANGTGEVYCLTLATNVLTSTTPSAGNAISVKYLDGFFIALIANSNTFQVSALEDGTTWPAINQATISEFPDNAVGMEVSNRILGFFGQKKSVPYFNSGALFPFIPVPNVLIEEGAIGTYGISKLDNTVLWLSGNVDEGSGIAFRLNGYTPVRISNHDIERIWQSYATIADVVTYTFQDGGHKYWHLYFPTANASWRYDIATQQWHQVGTWNAAANAFQAHKSMWHTFNFGLHLVGDPFSGNIYSMEQGNLTDNGTPIRRVRRAPYIAKEHERMVHTSLEVFAEMGLPSQIPAPSIYPSFIVVLDGSGNPWTITIGDNGALFVVARPLARNRTRLSLLPTM